ncbi:hypothetical protein E4T44_10091 [Aureobasidium sp. EXF-8845]|nr:hypothetical protein E4T45_11386 [Aureobasidium sp. EXF-8846]KAI4824754.1 hypothetical protein E4T44_10091 [Aureobasidium sp. EXF-8845]
MGGRTATNSSGSGTQQSIEVRAGYFGVCSRSNGLQWVCGDEARRQSMQASNETNLVGLLHHFQSGVLFPGVLILSVVLTSVTVAIMATFPGWHEETNLETGSAVDVKPFPSPKVLRFCVACMFLSTLFSLTAAIWQHVAATSSASVLDYAFDKGWDTEVGSVAAGLVWTFFFMNAIVMLFLFLLMYTIALIDRLTDE